MENIDGGERWDGWRRDLADKNSLFVPENEAEEHKCDRDKRGAAGSDGLC